MAKLTRICWWLKAFGFGRGCNVLITDKYFAGFYSIVDVLNLKCIVCGLDGMVKRCLLIALLLMLYERCGMAEFNQIFVTFVSTALFLCLEFLHIFIIITKIYDKQN